MSSILKITPTSYYRWLKRQKPQYQMIWNKSLAKKIRQIFYEYKQTYGAKRIQIICEKDGYKVSYKTVWKYCNKMHLKSFVRLKKHKKPKEIKNKNHNIPNLVNRQWSKYEKNELWVTDISFLPYGNKNFGFLSVMKDVKTGFIISYQMSKYNDMQIYRKTLLKAAKFRTQMKPLIIHSDNGYHYVSLQTRRYALENNIILSTSRIGNSIDNAACETFFSQIKTECLNLYKFKTYDNLKLKVDQYMKFYNYKRISIKHKNTPWNVYNHL